MIRASVLEMYDADYVRTARAIGMGEWRVLRTQVLRNALLPIVTMLGMDLGLAFAAASSSSAPSTSPGSACF